MTIRTFLAAFLFLLAFAGASTAQELRVGAAVRIITPNPLLPVSGGVGTPKKSTDKKGDLFARALVLEKGSVRVAIVSVDNLGWTSALGDRSRALIKGIPAENILIGSTHTHSAPDAYGFPDENGKSLADLAYLEDCVKKIADAVNEAVKNLAPATLKIAVGEAKGKIAYNYYADQLYDPRCGVIQATAKSNGKVIATLVNYAIHPEVIGSSQGILSPDLCGPLYDRIESKVGGVAIFMNGAQGGMVTADNRLGEGKSQGILSPDLCGPLYDRIESKVGGVAIFMNGAQGGMVTADNRLGEGKEANNWEECIRIGNLLADEALRIVGTAEVLDSPPLICSSRNVQFPVDSEMMRYILNNSPIKMTTVRDNVVTTRLNYLQIGKAKVLTIPGEALPNIGFYVKRNMNTDQPFLFGLTNDAFGYMLTKVDFNSFKRYEYVSRTSLGEMTGEIYIREVLAWLTEMSAQNQVKK
jgi:hypothetical protein